ncbi:DUF59 domain-containing protein [bacterium]|nr:DUF59 domain-containing protein [bacterium]
MINKESVVNVLKGIIDPEMGIDVYTLRLIKDLQISEKDGVIDLVFRPTSSVCPLAFQLTIEIKKGLLALVHCLMTTVTMAEAILSRIQGARSAAYPERYVSNEQRRRQKKIFSPKGMSSLVNFFLSLRLRTTKGTPRLSFVGIDLNPNIPLSSYL